MSWFRLCRGACGPLTVVALLLAVAWVSSYRGIIRVHLPTRVGHNKWECTSYRGLVSFTVTYSFPESTGFERRFERVNNRVTAALWDSAYWDSSYAGVLAEEGTRVIGTQSSRWSGLTIPFWLLVAVAGAIPAWEIFVICRNRHRRNNGLCPQCGYEVAPPEPCPACAARAQVFSPTARTHLVHPV